jgi:hypothetical protein
LVLVWNEPQIHFSERGFALPSSAGASHEQLTQCIEVDHSPAFQHVAQANPSDNVDRRKTRELNVMTPERPDVLHGVVEARRDGS